MSLTDQAPQHKTVLQTPTDSKATAGYESQTLETQEGLLKTYFFPKAN